MQVQRVQVNTADPVEVYQLVRSHLRGDIAGDAAADQLARAPAQILAGRGLAGSSRAASRSIAPAVQRCRPSRPAGVPGLSFYDNFRNKYIERYWRQRVGTFSEGVFFLDDGVVQSMTTNGAAVIGAQLLTAADTYSGDLDLQTSIWQRPGPTGTATACLFAQVSATYPSPMTLYVWLIDTETGGYEMTRYENGVGSVLFLGNIGGALPAPFTMRMNIAGGNLAGYINGALINSVKDGSPLPAGAVGLGSNRTGMQWDWFQCTKA